MSGRNCSLKREWRGRNRRGMFALWLKNPCWILKERERDGIDHTKTRWEEVRDSELNQKVLLELTPQEKTQWNELVEETDKLFVPKKKEEEKQNSSFQQYLPYIIGGVGIVAVIGLIIILATNNRRRD